MKLLVKSALFALFSQGVFAVLVPLLLAGERSVAGAWSLALAACLFAVGIVVYARCTWDFARFGRGTPSPFDGPRRLVTRGLYRHIRNPMYMAALALIAGWAALFASVPVAIYAAAVFAFLSLSIRFYEEPRLTRKFGDEYLRYRERTGRWLPARRRS